MIQIRRELISGLSEAAFDAVPSFHSDSAIAFGIFLHFLPSLESKLEPNVLREAMERTVAWITNVVRKNDIQEVSLLNFVVSDGTTMIATRYVFPDTKRAATLYYAEGKRQNRRFLRTIIS